MKTTFNYSFEPPEGVLVAYKTLPIFPSRLAEESKFLKQRKNRDWLKIGVSSLAIITILSCGMTFYAYSDRFSKNTNPNQTVSSLSKERDISQNFFSILKNKFSLTSPSAPPLPVLSKQLNIVPSEPIVTAQNMTTLTEIPPTTRSIATVLPEPTKVSEIVAAPVVTVSDNLNLQEQKEELKAPTKKLKHLDIPTQKNKHSVLVNDGAKIKLNPIPSKTIAVENPQIITANQTGYQAATGNPEPPKFIIASDNSGPSRPVQNGIIKRAPQPQAKKDLSSDTKQQTQSTGTQDPSSTQRIF